MAGSPQLGGWPAHLWMARAICVAIYENYIRRDWAGTQGYWPYACSWDRAMGAFCIDISIASLNI